MDAGAIAPQPVAPLAHVLIGALDECALYVARAADPAAARQQCTAILQQLLDGLRPDAGKRS
jgi:Tetracyclin repressor-like, C-terminal domain